MVALSPVSVLPARLLVLYSTRPRSAGLAFLPGWLAGLAALTALFLDIPFIDNTNLADAVAAAAGQPGYWSVTSTLSIDDAQAMFFQ